MKKRFTILGAILMVVGLGFFGGAVYSYVTIQDGYDSLQAFRIAPLLGELVDRGTTEGADAIMQLLTEEWGYPVVEADLDPNDPLVNTASEYMYQMATIGYHVMHGTVEVELTETVEYEGETFEPGVYEVEVDGRYWTGFDRMHPLDGPARAEAAQDATEPPGTPGGSGQGERSVRRSRRREPRWCSRW